MPDIIFRYFPSLTGDQKAMIVRMKPLYEEWNSRINVISRKDMDGFYVHHVLHSLAVAKVISFTPGTRILDVGTGGGFPGMPLAILFPDSEFTLLDSIAKKIKVVKEISSALGLKNVIPSRRRVEEENGRFDFVISRAVTGFPAFVKITMKNVSGDGSNSLGSGIICLKGGELEEEIGALRDRVRIWNIKDLFSEAFFETKKIVFLPID